MKKSTRFSLITALGLLLLIFNAVLFIGYINYRTNNIESLETVLVTIIDSEIKEIDKYFTADIYIPARKEYLVYFEYDDGIYKIKVPPADYYSFEVGKSAKVKITKYSWGEIEIKELEPY